MHPCPHPPGGLQAHCPASGSHGQQARRESGLAGWLQQVLPYLEPPGGWVLLSQDAGIPPGVLQARRSLLQGSCLPLAGCLVPFPLTGPYNPLVVPPHQGLPWALCWLISWPYSHKMKGSP